jgi:hypothetical protein
MPATVSLMVSGDQGVEVQVEGLEEEPRRLNPGQTHNFTLSDLDTELLVHLLPAD